ncbi:50S ribosomal protein L11 methyltransferase [Sphingomonas aerolata]|jgi:ribosomal protein L11 methyltransferase|uniref:50S ribosomal protein L11 methyltransferase n=1 Tax=Sphingomonas TaxID=13687 RepID=UPI0016158B7D|nr:50S ribosomal protein L11 methyltransferase [Sphingomonas sp. BK481]MBB3585390.1 ribosomal protein L11 methyltransferase [Sphingomonas sp. BK481]
MSAESWKLTLPCTRAEAEAIDASGDLGDAIPGDAVLMTTEEIEDDVESWRLDAYFEHEPGADTVAAVRALVPSAAGAKIAVERLAAADWVTMSQAGLEPLSVGRFFVHTRAHADAVPAGKRAFLIEASRAFGTGHHETTSGCLAMLDGLADAAPGERFGNVIDIGTGTGLLAFAAAHLWPDAAVMGTDIDPVSIEVTQENADLNGVAGIDLVVADGTLDDAIVARAPYDLVIANILAGPLVSMAPEIASIADAGATIVLAGLLETQRAGVVAAYAACGCSLEAVDRRGDWSVLRLRAGATRFVADGPFDPKGRDGWALDI